MTLVNFDVRNEDIIVGVRLPFQFGVVAVHHQPPFTIYGLAIDGAGLIHSIPIRVGGHLVELAMPLEVHHCGMLVIIWTAGMPQLVVTYEGFIEGILIHFIIAFNSFQFTCFDSLCQLV